MELMNISKSIIANKVNSNFVYAEIADQIFWAEKHGKTYECFEYDGIYIVVFEYENRISVELILYEFEVFSPKKIAEIIKMLNNKYSEYSVNVNALEFDEKEFDLIFLSEFEKCFEKYKVILNYVKNQSTNKNILNCKNIRLLNIEDEKIFSEFAQEKIINRPQPMILFEAFVKFDEGKILGYFKNNVLAGYLAYFKMCENIEDIDYIYILPNFRNNGIGKELAEYYSESVLLNNKAAYWSNAQNEPSRKIVVKSGFWNCAKKIVYKKIK